MLKIYLFMGLLATLGAMGLAGTAAYRASAATTFSRGYAAGAADLTAKLNRQLDQERIASAAVVADANHRVSLLEQDRAQLENQYGELKDALNAKIDANGKIDANSKSSDACLDSGIVHLLNAIGASSSAQGGRP